MKTPLDPLLNDVLNEAASPDYRAAVLSGTLHEARRRQSTRHRLRVALAGACVLAVAGIALWQHGRPLPIGPAVTQLPGLVVVHTAPLDPKLVVETRPGSVNVVQSAGATYALVETGDGRGLFQEINDDQLLALLSGHPAVLVRRGPGQSELVFVNPEDAHGWRVQ